MSCDNVRNYTHPFMLLCSLAVNVKHTGKYIYLLTTHNDYMCTKRFGYKFIYIQVQHTIAYMVHVDEKRCTGQLQNMNMTWISAHMKYSIHMHVHEEKDRETHGLNLEMNRTVWKNFLSLLAAALDLKEFFCYWSGRLEQNMPRALDT